MRCQAQSLIDTKFIPILTSPPLPPSPSDLCEKSRYAAALIPFCTRTQASGEAEFPAPSLSDIAWSEGDFSFEQRLIERDMAGRVKRETITKISAQAKKSEKLLAAVIMAVRSGNLGTALLLFAGAEAQQAREMSGLLLQKMQAVKAERHKVAQQIANLPQDKTGSTQLPLFQQQLSDLDGDMGIYQQILKDILQEKTEALELANSVSQAEHQTLMSIARR